ncbi:sensor histidine kinase [Janthinobacterium fluminis]|uniref:Oxygen sensor histidine kinase NreB n=1 Tax=Janthinobacterium fluminis TaxID=2987524 RepID=A0ABT5JWL1_9BURK|nr:sensor histidine kinase [Janthinobacterium fluminis]MDC8756810.1 sensor histidine kinase [Janthinobacterium fluminis]
MKFTPQRLVLAACVGCSGALTASAEPTVLGDTLWQQPGALDLPAVTALLALGVAAALWRRRRRGDTVASLRRDVARQRMLRVSAERALLDTQTSLCKLAALQDAIKENERRRIGRDIHDDLGQNLLAIKIDIALLRRSCAALHPQLHQKLGVVAENIELTIQSLRCIINDLRPTALEAGLKVAVERQLSEFSRISGIGCELDADGGALDGAANAELDTMVLRVLQESLSNVARHAKASAVQIGLHRNAAALTMTVRDNGVGMPSEHTPCGCGLLGIKDRVAAAGGRFAIDSRPGQGTALSLSIPLALALPAC